MSKGVELHSFPVIESTDLRGKERLVDLAISTTATSRSTGDIEGDIHISTNINCYVRVSPTSAADAQTVSASNGWLLRAYERESTFVRKNQWIGVVTESGTGTVTFHPVG